MNVKLRVLLTWTAWVESSVDLDLEVPDDTPVEEIMNQAQAAAQELRHELDWQLAGVGDDDPSGSQIQIQHCEILELADA